LRIKLPGSPLKDADMTKKFSCERVDKDVQRIMCGESIVAFALRLCSGKWGAYDISEDRLTEEVFNKPQDVCNWIAAQS
jgi:hypothetical protein